MRIGCRLLVGALLGAVACGPGAADARAAGDAQQLADRYAPIVMVREQTDPPCDT
jgi:hypothetical protein